MRKYLLIALSAVFVANTTLASAWAKPVTHDMQQGAPWTQQQAAPDGEPPCSQHGSQENGGQHCAGLCLCTYLSASPTLHLISSEGIPIPAAKKLFPAYDEALASIHRIPPEHPPKILS